MRVSYGLVIICIFASFSHAQAIRGTVGIIDYTSEKIIIAADSRYVREDGRHRDDDCKIAALGKHMVFFAVNVTGGEGSDPRIPNWTASQEAHRAYEHLAPYYRGQSFVAQVGDEWASSVRDKLNLGYRYFPSQASALVDNGILTRALFAESVADRLIVYMIVITPPPSIGLAIPGLSLGSVGIERQSVPTAWGFLGGYDAGAIFKEFYVEVTSPRARQEADRWAKESQSISANDRDIMNAIRLSQLAIDNDATGKVGGKVDALELPRGGEVRWKQKKDNCPAE